MNAKQRYANRKTARKVFRQVAKGPICNFCGQPGSHFAPPSMGQAGFYACENPPERAQAGAESKTGQRRAPVVESAFLSRINASWAAFDKLADADMNTVELDVFPMLLGPVNTFVDMEGMRRDRGTPGMLTVGRMCGGNDVTDVDPTENAIDGIVSDFFKRHEERVMAQTSTVQSAPIRGWFNDTCTKPR